MKERTLTSKDESAAEKPKVIELERRIQVKHRGVREELADWEYGPLPFERLDVQPEDPSKGQHTDPKGGNDQDKEDHDIPVASKT